MVTATKTWSCECGCSEKIRSGEQFHIRAGTFYKQGHEPDAKTAKPKLVLKRKEAR